MLLPVVKPGEYITVGYNWFNLKIGEFNSCVTWKTAQEAVKDYHHYNIRNVEIILKEI